MLKLLWRRKQGRRIKSSCKASMFTHSFSLSRSLSVLQLRSKGLQIILQERTDAYQKKNWFAFSSKHRTKSRSWDFFHLPYFRKQIFHPNRGPTPPCRYRVDHKLFICQILSHGREAFRVGPYDRFYTGDHTCIRADSIEGIDFLTLRPHTHSCTHLHQERSWTRARTHQTCFCANKKSLETRSLEHSREPSSTLVHFKFISSFQPFPNPNVFVFF